MDNHVILNTIPPRPKECTCRYPEVICRNMCGHEESCPVYQKWANDLMMASLTGRIKKLEDAIRAHRSQLADDRCIEDDDRLYAVLGDGVTCDRRVGSKAEMLSNCARFIERRCESGYWPSYQDLRADLKIVLSNLLGEATLAGNIRLIRYVERLKEKYHLGDDESKNDR